MLSLAAVPSDQTQENTSRDNESDTVPKKRSFIQKLIDGSRGLGNKPLEDDTTMTKDQVELLLQIMDDLEGPTFAKSKSKTT